MDTLIDPSRMNAVKTALLAVFGQEMPESISLLAGGYSSSQMFQITVKDETYVLRVMDLDHPLSDRENQIACARYGGQLSVAPLYVYAHAEDGIILMEYLSKGDLPKTLILEQMSLLLKRFHHSGPIPHMHQTVFSYLEGLMKSVETLHATDEIVGFFQIIRQAMSQLNKVRQLASCHNDLNINNMMNHHNRLTLVDFEAAGLEDPYYDVATVCQQFCLTPEEEVRFLTDYLERAPTLFDLQKIALMKQVSYFYYASHFLQFSYEQGVFETEAPVHTLEEWGAGIKSGDLKLETPSDFLSYADAFMNEAARQRKSPYFSEAFDKGL
jgi:aminoglycoside phosphotransferase (APT) family kinase protein